MKKHIKISYFVLVIFVALNLFLFSTVSPLHNIMNMQYNEWLYYLIGKGMTKGAIPYVDLVDHKGPYLFYLFAFINLFPYRHIGFFIVATIIYSFIAIATYNICLIISYDGNILRRENEIENDEDGKFGLFNVNVICIIVAFIIQMICSSYYISFGTMSAEIVTLPFILISYYLFLKYLYSGKMEHSIKYIVIYGINAGIVFFVKANAVLSFVPIMIYLLCTLIKNKKNKNLFLNFIFGLAAFIIALMPAIIYSIATHSFYDMIEGAFTINILYTGTGMPSSPTAFDSLLKTLVEFKEWTAICIMSIFAFYYLIRKSAYAGNDLKRKVIKNLMIFYVLSLVINIYSTYMSMRPYTNYLANLMFYMVIVILFFVKKLFVLLNDENNMGHISGDKSGIESAPLRTVMNMLYNDLYNIGRKKIKISFIIAIVVVINILSYSLTYEVSNINGEKQGTIAKRVVRIYNSSDKKIKKPKTLVVGYAPYLYEAFDAIPNEKYFATPVVSRKVYEKPYSALINRIKKGDEDLILVSFERQMLTDKNFQEEVYDALSYEYENIGDANYLGEKVKVYVKK